MSACKPPTLASTLPVISARRTSSPTPPMPWRGWSSKTPCFMEACFRLLEQSAIPTLDITGGAPELHPHFREMVERARALGRHVIDRCNLTITQLPNYADLPEFLAVHRVEVIASLPAYAPSQTDAQRGEGVSRTMGAPDLTFLISIRGNRPLLIV